MSGSRRDGCAGERVDLPPMPPDVQRRLAPWLDLAGRLGRLAGQLAPAGLTDVEVETAGEVSELGSSPVSAAVLAGVLGTFLEAPVNWVNARLVAGDRGLRVAEIRCTAGSDFRSAVSVRLRGAEGERFCRGTLYHAGDQPEARVVQLDSFRVEIAPEGTLLYVCNKDVPGVIGAIGTILGEGKLNVGRLEVGQDRARGEAVALWSLEGTVGDAILARLRQVPNVLQVLQVRL